MISNVFINAKNSIQSAWGNVSGWFGDVWNQIISHFQPDMISKGFGSAWSNIQDAWHGAGSWFGGIWDSIKNGFKALNPFSWGGDLINGLADGIRNAAYIVNSRLRKKLVLCGGCSNRGRLRCGLAEPGAFDGILGRLLLDTGRHTRHA